MLTAAVCIALTGAGLTISVVTAWRRRFLTATRMAAWSLLPVGLYMTGLLDVGRKIGKAIGAWSADLVLKPTVWSGFALLALAVILWGVAHVVGRRSGRRGSGGRGAGRQVSGSGDAPAAAPTASTIALGPGQATRPKGSPARKAESGDDGLADFKEIEEILRRRGI